MITEETAIEMSVPVEVLRVTEVREETTLTLPVLREGSLYVFENSIYEVRHMAGTKGIHRVLRSLWVKGL